MNLTIELPGDLEAVIRQHVVGDLNAYSREALAVQLYREQKLTHGQLQRFLGVGRYEADAILKEHGGVDELTADELAAQVQASHDVRNKPMTSAERERLKASPIGREII